MESYCSIFLSLIFPSRPIARFPALFRIFPISVNENLHGQNLNIFIIASRESQISKLGISLWPRVPECVQACLIDKTLKVFNSYFFLREGSQNIHKSLIHLRRKLLIKPFAHSLLALESLKATYLLSNLQHAPQCLRAFAVFNHLSLI